MTASETLLRALGDATRQRILQVLLLHELSVSELVEVLHQPQSTVSRHLKVLREAGLLLDRKLGTTVMYSAREPASVANDCEQEVYELNGPGNGNGRSMLRDRLIDWVAHEPLVTDIEQRLQEIIRRRRSGRAFFENIGTRWDHLRIESFGPYFHLEALTALLPSDWTVADIGTGTGYMLPILASRFARVIAVDPADSMLDAARSHANIPGQGKVEFREGALSALPLADSEVDLALSSLVLHHVADPRQALSELQRCLAPEGRLLLIEQVEHDDADFYERMGDHWWGFSPGTLADWVRQAGFAQVRAHALTTPAPTGKNGHGAPPLFVLVGQKAPAE